MLVYQLVSSRAAVSDRLYRALYAVLATDGPATSNRAPMFLALVFKVRAGPLSHQGHAGAAGPKAMPVTKSRLS